MDQNLIWDTKSRVKKPARFYKTWIPAHNGTEDLSSLPVNPGCAKQSKNIQD